jgi:hypothetical protein
VDDAGRKRSPAHISAATWRFVEVSGGYTIINGYSNKCLDIRGPSNANGTPAHQWNCHGGRSQVWRLRRSPSGRELVNAYANKCLDVANFGNVPGNYLQIWSCSLNWNQGFRLFAAP